jgi:hypothetical protein
MWQQWFSTPGYSYSTGDRLTMLKLDGAARPGMTAEERRAEMLAWIERSSQPGFESWLATEVAVVFRRHAIRGRLDHDAWADRATEERKSREACERVLSEQNAALTAELARCRDQVAGLEAAEAWARQAQSELDAMRRTRTWRFHDSLARRSIGRWLARH